MKNNLYTLLFVLCTTTLVAQDHQGIWSKISKREASVGKKMSRKVEPSKSIYYQLDINKLNDRLSPLLSRNTNKNTSQPIIQFPNSQGGFDSFRVRASSILEAAYQEKHPEIRTYIGQNITTPSSVISFSITPQGLHAMTLSSNTGTQFIDPYAENNTYMVYSKGELSGLKQRFQCLVSNDATTGKATTSKSQFIGNANDSKLRTYRLALASTIEYSEFHWRAAGLTASSTIASKTAAVLAAMVVTINRVNTIYQRDLAIKLVLIDNSDIIFIDSDNFTNDNARELINESQNEIDNAIPSAAYDIGHTFSTGGGGLAAVGSVCVSTRKASGITGSPVPVGDAYDIDFVAHEFGHQFGAPHTFNGNTGNCAGINRIASNAYETGSGSTIMAYAGICSPQNVQLSSDVYFHQKSIQVIWDNITSGASTCGAESPISNNPPVANAGPDYTIPISTPFKLVGSSTDPDGTAGHTYTWEQYDLGASGLPLETNTTGPLVRSFEGTSNPVRYVPRMVDYLASGGSSIWEKIPSVERTMNFALTVRDNDVMGTNGGGQTSVDFMEIQVTDGTISDPVGPFVVTSQATTGISWTQEATETITWNVANTDNPSGINTQFVNILLSTDGGENFNVTLKSNTPNDGSETITVPDIAAPFCRIMVEPVNNIYYAVNITDFAIGYTVTTTCNQRFASDPNPLELAILDRTETTNSINIPSSGIISDVKVNVNISHTYIGDLNIVLTHPNNSTSVTLWANNCSDTAYEDLNIIFEDETSLAVCASPTLGTYAPANALSVFDGLNTTGDWKLAVFDNGTGDIGELNSWYIEFCTLEARLSTSTETKFSNLNIFPNPNKGEFTVTLNNSNSESIFIDVYDLRGRHIYKNKYDSRARFNEKINLNTIQSGMYILTVNDGTHFSSKKIIIE